MNTINAAPSKLFAAALSAVLTTVVTASIVFGMAGLPGAGHNAGQPVAVVASAAQQHG